MIRARLSDGRFLFGLDAMNVYRLVSGQPIMVDLTEMGGSDKFMLMFGATYESIIDEIEQACGEPMPEARERLKEMYESRRKDNVTGD